MTVEFTLQPPSGAGVLPLAILAVTGAALIVLAFATGRRAKSVRRTFVVMLILGVMLIGLGVGLSYSVGAPTTVTVGDGYLYIKSSSFWGTGNLNITSNQIRGAYVGEIGVGNLTISKQHGTNIDDFNVGVFTLGSGATAYIASDNSTSLVIQLLTGRYVIVGTDDTSLLVSAFSETVHPVQDRASQS